MGVRSQQRRYSRIQGDEANFDLVVTHPERQFVLGQGAEPGGQWASAFAGLTGRRPGATQQSKDHSELGYVHGFPPVAVANTLSASSAMPSPDRLLVTAICSGLMSRARASSRS